MSAHIDEKVLDNLIKYESVVKQQLSDLEDRLWIQLDFNVIRKYDDIKKMILEISSIVDLAFCIYGENSGVMKTRKDKVDPLKIDKLNSLVGRISKIKKRKIDFEKLLKIAV